MRYRTSLCLSAWRKREGWQVVCHGQVCGEVNLPTDTGISPGLSFLHPPLPQQKPWPQTQPYHKNSTGCVWFLKSCFSKWEFYCHHLHSAVPTDHISPSITRIPTPQVQPNPGYEQPLLWCTSELRSHPLQHSFHHHSWWHSGCKPSKSVGTRVCTLLPSPHLNSTASGVSLHRYYPQWQPRKALRGLQTHKLLQLFPGLYQLIPGNCNPDLRKSWKSKL